MRSVVTKSLEALGLLVLITLVVQIYLPLIRASLWLSQTYVPGPLPYNSSWGDVAKSTGFGLVWLAAILVIGAMFWAWLNRLQTLVKRHHQERRDRRAAYSMA